MASNNQFDMEKFYEELNSVLASSAPDLHNYVSNMLHQSAMVFISSAFPQLNNQNLTPAVQTIISHLINTYVLPGQNQEKK